MSTNAVVRYQKPEDVRAEMNALTPQFAEVLPAGVDAKRFTRLVIGTIIANPSILDCTRDSIIRSVRDAASLGLVPTGLLGSAYLVPYKNKRTGQMEAQLIPGYRGLIDLARRSGEIDAIEANTVRLRDRFRIYKGTVSGVEHEPFIPDPTLAPEDRDPGPYVGAYMVATLKGGHRQVEWMTTDEIEAVRKRSRASDQGPWVTDWSEMARKTVVRRGAKYLPLTPDAERALSLDEQAERDADPVETASAQMTPAQRILAQRVEARLAAGQVVTADGEVIEGTAQDGPGQPVQAEAATGTAEGASEAPGQPTAATEATAQPAEAAPATATQVCNDDGGMLGRCSRAPGHTGRHDSGQGQWAQERKR